MKFFKVDLNRDRVASDVAFYKCDMMPVVKKAIELGKAMPFDHNELPSWPKVAEDPVKAEGFLVPMAEAMFMGRHNLKAVNTNQAWAPQGDLRVCLMFLTGTTRKENIEAWANVMQNALMGWYVVPIYGDAEDVSGNKGMTQADIEKDAKEWILKARQNNVKSILFVAAHMAQRSFSVPELTEVYLAYDNGDAGATIQKMSRVLTSDNTTTKIGRIISLSFDPNRDDKFDPWIVTTAKNLAKRAMIPIKQALRQVLDTLDIYSMTGQLIKLDYDRYHEEMLERNGFAKIMGGKANLSVLNVTDGDALVEMHISDSGAKQPAAEEGKKFNEKHYRGGKDRPRDREKEIKKALKFIAEYLDVFVLGTNSKTVDEMVHCLMTEQKYRDDFENKFHIPVELVERLFTPNAQGLSVLDRDFLELHVNA